METFGQPNDSAALLQEVIDRVLLGVNTSIPATVQSFKSSPYQAVKVTPNIKMINTSMNGKSEMVQMPDLIEVPILMLGSSTLGMSITIPIVQGDQCLLIFSQRSIDNWFEFGGIQNPAEKIYPRHHSINDAIAIVGLWPKAESTAISDYNNSAIEIRNKDKSVYLQVSNTAVNIKSPVTTIDGNLIVTGTVSGTGGTAPLLTAAGISHLTKIIDASHEHSGVTGGSGHTGGVE